MTKPITLNGIAWNHTRGFVPLVATAQRFGELHPNVEIHWHKRSLQAFADFPVEQLVEQYDLLIIDHPFAGKAAAKQLLLPLDEWLSADFLADQHANSVGASHTSYQWNDHQWGLATDAATPVSAHRPDLFARHNLDLPETWDDLIALAKAGFVAVPAIPIDSLMNWYMLCLALGEAPFSTPERIVSDDVGQAAMAMLRQLVTACDPVCLTRNPIATYEAMTRGDDIAYCPFAYGYTNYSRRGYARHHLRFGGLVSFNGSPLRSTLGGAGLAISPHCQQRETAVAYAGFVGSAEIQRTTYFDSGGQPGHRSAWEDDHNNAITDNFFRNTLPTLDAAYLRPRYNGYLHFQDTAGPVLHNWLTRGGDCAAVLAQLNNLYHKETPQ